MRLIANIGINWWTKKSASDRAHTLVAEAAEAGAHAVCVPYLNAAQTYRKPDLVAQFKKYDMPPELLYDLRDCAREYKIDFIVAPWYHGDIKYLEQLSVDGYHVVSENIEYTPLLRGVAGTGKYSLLSTAFATMGEIDNAVNELIGVGAPDEADFVLLHSTGGMPTPAQDADIRRILNLMEEFYPLYVGYESFLSSQSFGLDYVAMALGPTVIMRRFDLEDARGIEAAYSLSPAQFSNLSKMAAVMEQVNNPVIYAEEFTESDFQARISRRRCKEGDFLLPTES